MNDNVRQNQHLWIKSVPKISSIEYFTLYADDMTMLVYPNKDYNNIKLIYFSTTHLTDTQEIPTVLSEPFSLFQLLVLSS